jgi:serine/threonine protein kinase
MFDFSEFRKRLKQDAVLKRDLQAFVTHLCSGRWDSQREMENDSKILEVFSGKARALSFVRQRDRMVRDGTFSARGLERLAYIFFDQLDTGVLLAKFEEWRSTRMQQRVGSGMAGGFVESKDGYYRLPDHTKLFGQYHEYLIRNPIESTEGRGDSYQAKVANRRTRVFIKTLTLETKLSSSQTQAHIDEFAAFLGREKEMLKRLRGTNVQGVAKFLDDGRAPLLHNDGKVLQVPFIVIEFIDGETLDVFIRKRYAAGKGVEFRGITEPRTWTHYVTQLMKLLHNIHAANVRHGDLHVSNVMVQPRGERLALVDFGQSGIPAPDTPTIQGGSQQSVSGRAPERRRHPEIPLETAEDIYGLGRIALWLASGEEFPDEGFKGNASLKAYIERTLENNNPKLLQAIPGLLYMLVQALHYNPRERASYVEDLEHTLEQFGHADEPWFPPPQAKVFERQTQQFAEHMRLIARDHSLLALTLRREAMELMRRAQEMRTCGRLVISGTRQQIIAAMLEFLRVLKKDDLYVTVSTPLYWSSFNLGIRGRVWALTKHLAAKGVRIRRLLVTHPPTDRGYVRNDLEEIFNAQAELIESLPLGITRQNKGADAPGCYIGVLRVNTDAQKRRILCGGYHVAIVRTQESVVSLSFQVDDRQTVRKLILWNVPPSFLTQRLKDIEGWFAKSAPIEQWRSIIGDARTPEDESGLPAKSE